MIRLALILCLLSPPAWAADFCDMDTVLASYNAAFNRKKLGDEEGAHKSFARLAQVSVAPAQRHLAEYYLEESREKNAIEFAIMWAQLAAWGGDEKAAKLVKQIVDASRHQVAEAGLKWANDWRPPTNSCVMNTQSKDDDDDFKTAGRFPVIRHEDVDEEKFALIVGRLYEALVVVEKVAPYFSPLIEFIPAFEIIQGSDTDRYLAWDEEQNWLQLSTGYLQDETARQLSYGLVLAVQRRLFQEIKDATFVDQVATNWGRVKIFGSLYGDVRTKKFLTLARDAVKKARELPVVLRDKVNLLHEIHYMPPSRYHFSRLPSDKRFSHYDHLRSHPEKRMVIFSHKIAFEEVDDILLHLVKAGAQAQQHAKIEGMKGNVDGKQREDAILRALEGNPTEVLDMFSNSVAKQKETLDAWDDKGPDGVKRLYCDAIFDQVKAAIILNMHPNKFSRSVDLKGCKKAQKAWRDHRSNKPQK